MSDEVKIIRKCMFCDTVLEFEANGVRMAFTAHDDSFCKGAMLGKIRALEGAVKSMAEVSAMRNFDYGRRIGWDEAKKVHK